MVLWFMIELRRPIHSEHVIGFPSFINAIQWIIGLIQLVWGLGGTKD